VTLLALPDRAEQIFEHGDRIYMTAPVQVFEPAREQIEEYAFSSQVASSTPNEHIVWMKGQYVEADRPNLNGAQWTAGELAIKALTPRLMPVTVMHDPRTAVGTIADVKLLTPEKDQVPRARIETILALWAHRFPEAVNEAVVNAKAGSLMQSMECLSPWYSCSECGSIYHKLPGGAEQAMWCDHLKASRPTGGYTDLAGEQAAAQGSNASRILGDVCFTGTGLIYGSRGARGAFTDAQLDQFQSELATYHETAHQATATSPASTYGGLTAMGMVQIDENELKILREERDSAKAQVTTLAAEKAAAEKAAEEAEAAKIAAETAKTAAEAAKASLEEAAQQGELKDQRLGALGAGFTAKLGEIAKTRLNEQAKSMSDEDWDGRLKELEQMAGVARDDKGDGTPAPAATTPAAPASSASAPTFESEEVAAFVNGSGAPAPTGESVAGVQRSAVIGKLASGFKPKSPAATK
jgi:hypothetical protein